MVTREGRCILCITVLALYVVLIATTAISVFHAIAPETCP